MMTSSVQHPSCKPLIIIHEWQLEFCNGNVAQAALLSYFEYWHNIKLEIVKTKAKSLPANKSNFVQHHTESELIKGILNIAKHRSTIRSAIKALVQLRAINVIKNPNTKFGYDKTKHYIFHPEIINEWLKQNYNTKDKNVHCLNTTHSNEPHHSKATGSSLDKIVLSKGQNCPSNTRDYGSKIISQKKDDDDLMCNFNQHARSNKNAKVVKVIEETKKSSSSVSLIKEKLKPDILDDIIYPKDFIKSQPALKELRRLPNRKAVQQVLDVYASKDNVRSPVGLIIVLVKNYISDDFTPIENEGIANDLNFTQIKEKTMCSCCRGSNFLWIEDSCGTNRVKCNHNELSILNKLEQDKSYIQGTKHDFRIKREHKPYTGTFWEQLKIHQQNEAKNKDVKPNDSSIVEGLGFKLRSMDTASEQPPVLSQQELLDKINASLLAKEKQNL